MLINEVSRQCNMTNILHKNEFYMTVYITSIYCIYINVYVYFKLYLCVVH